MSAVERASGAISPSGISCQLELFSMRGHSTEVLNSTGEYRCKYWATCLLATFTHSLALHCWLHLRAPLRSLIHWLARFAALTQSFTSLRTDVILMSHRIFLTIVRSIHAYYRQTSLQMNRQTDRPFFRCVYKSQKSQKLLLKIQ